MILGAALLVAAAALVRRVETDGSVTSAEREPPFWQTWLEMGAKMPGPNSWHTIPASDPLVGIALNGKMPLSIGPVNLGPGGAKAAPLKPQQLEVEFECRDAGRQQKQFVEATTHRRELSKKWLQRAKPEMKTVANHWHRLTTAAVDVVYERGGASEYTLLDSALGSTTKPCQDLAVTVRQRQFLGEEALRKEAQDALDALRKKYEPEELLPALVDGRDLRPVALKDPADKALFDQYAFGAFTEPDTTAVGATFILGRGTAKQVVLREGTLAFEFEQICERDPEAELHPSQQQATADPCTPGKKGLVLLTGDTTFLDVHSTSLKDPMAFEGHRLVLYLANF